MFEQYISTGKRDEAAELDFEFRHRMCEGHDIRERCRHRHARLSHISNVYDAQRRKRADRFAVTKGLYGRF